MNTATTKRNLAASWASNNGDILQAHCKKVFFGAFENMFIARAIKEKMLVNDENPEVANMQYRAIPKDYLLLKSAAKLTAKELRQRFHMWKDVLDIRKGESKGAEPMDVEWNEEQFMERYDIFREIMYLLYGPVIDTHMGIEFNAKYPDFTFANNRKVNSMKDWCDFIHQYVPSEKLPLVEVRAMNQFVVYGLWGKSNFWAEKGEHQILQMLELQYDGNRKSNGLVQKRAQRGGFVKAHGVRKLDMERHKVKEAWKRCFFEWPFNRDTFQPPKADDTEEKKEAKAKKAQLRKYIVHAKRETHLYEGSYLLCEGHPDRKRIDGETTKPTKPTKTKEQEEAEKKEAMILQLTNALRNTDGLDLSTILGALQPGNQGGSQGGIQSGNQGVAELLGLLNSVAGKKRSAIPHEVDVVGRPPAKKARMDFSSPGHSTGVVSDLSTAGNTTVMSDVGTAEDEEENALQNPESYELEGIDTTEKPPQSPNQTKLPAQQKQMPGKTPRNFRHTSTKSTTGKAAVAKAKSTTSTPSVMTPSKQPPSSPSKNSERLSPSTKYVIPRLPDGYCCNGKHHDSPLDWVSYESNYFTKTYKKGKTHLPTHCLRCSARLMSAREAKQLGKTSKEKVYAVTGSQSVWACQEVFTPSAPGNKCNRVFCNTCYAIASNKVQCVPL